MRKADPQTHTQTNRQTGPITIRCPAKLSAQCNYRQWKTENKRFKENNITRQRALAICWRTAVVVHLRPTCLCYYEHWRRHGFDVAGAQTGNFFNVPPIFALCLPIPGHSRGIS